MQQNVRRRTVLAGIGASGLAAIAGCTNLPTTGSGPGPRPGYHRYVAGPDAGDEGTFFTHLDIARLRALEQSAQSFDEAVPGNFSLDSSDPFNDADPLVAYPAAGVFVGVFAIAFGIVPYGFGTDVIAGFGGPTTDDETENASTTTTDTPVTIDSILLVRDAFVLTGSIDRDTVVAATSGFESAGDYGEYELFLGADSDVTFIDTTDLGFAISDEAIVALLGDDGDPRARLEGVLDTADGTRDRLSDDPDGDWALRTAGSGVASIGGFGVDPDQAAPAENGQQGGFEIESIFDEAEGLVSSLSIADEQVTGEIAAVFPEEAVPERAQIEAAVGTSAAERSISIDGTRVTITGTWTDLPPSPTETP